MQKKKPKAQFLPSGSQYATENNFTFEFRYDDDGKYLDVIDTIRKIRTIIQLSDYDCFEIGALLMSLANAPRMRQLIMTEFPAVEVEE